MYLVIMRHGHAEREDWPHADASRCLTLLGEQGVVNQGMAEQDLLWNIDNVFVSPYLRTQQTLACLQPCLNDPHVSTSSALTPAGAPDEVQALLVAQESNTLLVTHQPLASYLIGHFVNADPYDAEPMLPGSLAVLEGEVIAKGCMQLVRITHEERDHGIF